MGLLLSARPPTLKKHPLNLAIDGLHNGGDPWPIEWMMFNVLNDYLQLDSKLPDHEAARCIDAILPENRPLPLNEDTEPTGNWMVHLSGLIWVIAKQIPCDHEGQDKLVQLLRALKRLPITQIVKNSRGEQLPAWDALVDWHDCMRFAIVCPERRDSPTQRTCDKYVNASAFAARVHAAGVGSPSRSHVFAAIPTAVELRDPGPELLPCHLIAGAQWIVWATEWLWSDIRWGEIDCHEEAATTGEDKDVKYWARLAAAKMERIMRTEGFTAQKMETWNPEMHSLRAYMWDDEKYGHFFRVPQQA